MEGRCEEVQKERVKSGGLDFEAGGGRRKSKRSSKSVGLDFEVAGRCEKVQNASWRVRAEDQTSHDQTSHLCKKYIKSHKPLALKLTSSRIIHVSNNLHFYERRGVIIMKYMDKDDFEKQNVFGTGQANTAYAKYFIGDSFLNLLCLVL